MKSKEFDNKVIGKIKQVFEVEEKNSHHKIFRIFYKNKMILRTFRSHSSKEISKSILQSIKRELRLNNIDELNRMKDCTLSAEEYYKILKKKSII